MAHTRFESATETATPIFPMIPLGSPGRCVISVQVSPPSVDLYKPLAGPPLESVQGGRQTSQRMAKSTRELCGSRHRSAAPAQSFLYRTLFHFSPPSGEGNTPRKLFGT